MWCLCLTVGKKTQLCHANLYFRRELAKREVKPSTVTDKGKSSPPRGPLVAALGSIESLSSGSTASPSLALGAALEEGEVGEPDDAVLLGRLKNLESLANIPQLLSHLTREQASELEALIK